MFYIMDHYETYLFLNEKSVSRHRQDSGKSSILIVCPLIIYVANLYGEKYRRLSFLSLLVIYITRIYVEHGVLSVTTRSSTFHTSHIENVYANLRLRQKISNARTPLVNISQEVVPERFVKVYKSSCIIRQ